MKSKIADRLLTIKSIVTLALTMTVVYLAATGIIDHGEIMDVYLIIIGFYFGSQHERALQEGGYDHAGN